VTIPSREPALTDTPLNADGQPQVSPENPFAKLPRCQALSRTTGKRCGNPAMKDKRVCYRHGGKGGAPKGNKNALVHGKRSEATINKKRALRAMVREIDADVKALSKEVDAHVRTRDRLAKAEEKAREKMRAEELDRQVSAGEVALLDLDEINRILLENDRQIEARLELERKRKADAMFRAPG